RNWTGLYQRPGGHKFVFLNLGGQVVAVRPPVVPGRPGRDPLTQARTQSIEAPPELVAVALHRVFEGQVRELAPGQASKQVPDGPLGKPPRVRPERATVVAEVLVGEAGQHRKPVGGPQAGMHLPDDQRLGRVGDGTAGEYHLAGPDPVGADREMLVEVDAAPDRAPDG